MRYALFRKTDSYWESLARAKAIHALAGAFFAVKVASGLLGQWQVASGLCMDGRNPWTMLGSGALLAVIAAAGAANIHANAKRERAAGRCPDGDATYADPIPTATRLLAARGACVGLVIAAASLLVLGLPYSPGCSSPWMVGSVAGGLGLLGLGATSPRLATALASKTRK